MNRKTFAGLLLAGLMGTAAWGQTADEIVAKNTEARGGLDKIKAVKTMRLTGKVMSPMGEIPLVIETARPHKLRQEFVVQGMTGISAYDGTSGWSVMPFMGKKDPEPMSADDLKQVEEQADMIEGPLVDYKEKGHTVEFLGKDEVEGTPVYKLKVTKKNGDVQTLYLDADSFLEIKAEGKTKMRGQEIEGETTFGDYKEVGGLIIAHSIQGKMKGGQGQGQTITFEKIEINPDIPASRFEMPAKPAETPKPATPEETPKQQ